jgi:MFS family permease
MYNFLIIWLGQLVSTFGSRMAGFVITFWVWDISGKATSVALLIFFSQLTQLLVTPFAGVVVDRSNRKLLIIFGDAIAALSTIVVILLFLNENLHIWHLYLAKSISGIFGQFQELAYSSSITTLIPKKQYYRAASLRYFIKYAPKIIAPALAGILYSVIGLVGVLAIDLITFVFAVGTILPVHMPNSIQLKEKNLCCNWTFQSLYQEIIAGYRYIVGHPELLVLMTFMSLFCFFHDLGGAIFTPMILSRSGNNPAILGNVSASAGLGGIVGALAMSIWGGPRHKIYGILIGIIGAGLSKSILGIGQSPLIWLPAQFFSSLNFPLIGSSEQAIWLAKVRPDIQGRVFGLSSFCSNTATSVSYLIAGPLVDSVLEPAMSPAGKLAPIFGRIFGTHLGSGMALLYVFTSICFLLIGAIGFALPQIHHLEDNHQNSTFKV